MTLFPCTKLNILACSLILSLFPSLNVSAMEPQINKEIQQQEKELNEIRKDNSLTQRDVDLLFSKNLNYIHEPFWGYDKTQLEGYAKRILKKINPLIIESKDIQCENKKCFIQRDNEKIRVQKEIQFGRVLPTLYLNEKLKDNPKLAVPRIFLVPKNPKAPVKFTFTFPFEGKNLGDVGNNPLQVLCDDFDIYKEYIVGEGKVGDTSFRNFGHMDYNSVQIIKGPDSRLYLIDTKEQKNFFLPIFFGYQDIMFHPLSFNFHSGSQKHYKTWQRNIFNFMIEVKNHNLGEDTQSVDITVDCGIHCDLEHTPSPPENYKNFDFSATNPRLNLLSAIKDGNILKATEILSQNSDISLSEEGFPVLGINSIFFESPVSIAIQQIKDPEKRLAMVRFLAENGASLNGTLFKAIYEEDTELVSLLLNFKAEPTSTDIGSVISKGNMSLFKLLFENRKDDQIFSKNMKDAVFSKKPNIDIIKILASVSGQKDILDVLLKLLQHKETNSNDEEIAPEVKEEIGLLLLDYVKYRIPDDLLQYVLKNNFPKLRERLFELDINIPKVFSYASYYDKPEFVDLLIQKKTLTNDEIDDGIDSALVNFRWQIVHNLLLLKPAQLPKTASYIDKLSSLELNMILEHAILSKDDLLFELVYPRLKKVDSSYFLWALDSNNILVIKKLLAPDFLKRVGVVSNEQLQHKGSGELSGLLQFILIRSFDYHNREVIHLIEENYRQYLGKIHWEIGLAIKSGHGNDIVRFLKTNEDYAVALRNAAQYGKKSLVDILMNKLNGTPEEPQALDWALHATILNLDKSNDHKIIKDALWGRIIQLERPIIKETILACIFTESSNLELLKQTLEQIPYNLNYNSAMHWCTPLIAAIASNNLEMVQYLLEKGADPNLPGTLTYPLSAAILLIVEIVPATVEGIRRYEREYMRNKADERNLDNIQDNNLKIIKLLIKHGAKINLSPEEEKKFMYREKNFIELARSRRLHKVVEYLDKNAGRS